MDKFQRLILQQWWILPYLPPNKKIKILNKKKKILHYCYAKKKKKKFGREGLPVRFVIIRPKK